MADSFYFSPLISGEAEEAGLLTGAETEAVEEIMALAGKFFKKVRRDIKYYALIDRGIVDDRTVEFSGVDQKNIFRQQFILFSLNDITYIAPEEDHDLVKVMIMEGKADAVLVRDVKQLKAAFQVAGFLLVIIHRAPSFIRILSSLIRLSDTRIHEIR